MFERRPSGLLAPRAGRSIEVVDPDLEQLLARRRAAGALPPIAGGAPSWIFSLPLVLLAFGGTVTRGPSVEASEASANLLSGSDAPTMMTEWVLTGINIVAAAEYHSAAAEFPTPAVAQVIAQLLIGGDVVWQGSVEQPLVKNLKFASTKFRITGDFNNPITLPRGRALALRFVSIVSVETDQTIIGVSGNNGTNPVNFSGVGSLSTIPYNVRELTGHRTL